MSEELTKEDVRKIEAEILKRKLELRPNLIEAVKEARAQGDLSENFEYYAAKREKNQNESRIRYLERILKFAKVISTESKADEVGMNDTVTPLFPGRGRRGGLPHRDFHPRTVPGRENLQHLPFGEGDYRKETRPES